MKKLISLAAMLLIFSACSQAPQKTRPSIRDGFYQVMALDTGANTLKSLPAGQISVEFDTTFNSGYTKAAIDTLDYVPLQLDTLPVTEQQTDTKKLLSITLTQMAAKKMNAFTATRVMKEVAIVIGGKAIIMHKIREAITGNKMQITRCGDNACEYLYVKMKEDVKH